jgi:hypothetical protein
MDKSDRFILSSEILLNFEEKPLADDPASRIVYIHRSSLRFCGSPGTPQENNESCGVHFYHVGSIPNHKIQITNKSKIRTKFKTQN